MPRQARLRIAGMPLHVIQRGINRAPCFATDGDRRVYLAMLNELAAAFPCDVHAFVLMTNHVHILATPRQAPNISLVMKHLGQRYVQYFNRAHERTGSLWEGRFRSSLVETESYFLCCQKYIELNPVRAGMVTDPRDYPWSSYQANALGTPSPLLNPHPIYIALGKDPAARAGRYAAFVREGMPAREIADIRDAINGGFALGSKGFIATLERLMQRPVGRRHAGRPRRAASDA